MTIKVAENISEKAIDRSLLSEYTSQSIELPVNQDFIYPAETQVHIKYILRHASLELLVIVVLFLIPATTNFCT